MSLLLDTHVLLWWAADAPQLSAAARRAVAEGDVTVFVSVASVWEMAIKCSLGKLRLPSAVGEFVAETLRANRFRLLPIELAHAARVVDLPHLHGDPFDRLLVAQALAEGLTLVTADPRLAAYGAPTLW